jgi:hypothetical protein
VRNHLLVRGAPRASTTFSPALASHSDYHHNFRTPKNDADLGY